VFFTDFRDQNNNFTHQGYELKQEFNWK